MDEIKYIKYTTPYGDFEFPYFENSLDQYQSIVNGFVKTNAESKAECERIEKEGEEKRKTREQTWSHVKTLAPVVIDHVFKSAVSAAADYYREKQEREAEKEKQETFDQLDLSGGNKPEK